MFIGWMEEGKVGGTERQKDRGTEWADIQTEDHIE